AGRVALLVISDPLAQPIVAPDFLQIAAVAPRVAIDRTTVPEALAHRPTGACIVLDGEPRAQRVAEAGDPAGIIVSDLATVTRRVATLDHASGLVVGKGPGAAERIGLREDVPLVVQHLGPFIAQRIDPVFDLAPGAQPVERLAAVAVHDVAELALRVVADAPVQLAAVAPGQNAALRLV